MPMLGKLGVTRSDQRAIEGHILLTGCSFFTGALLCASLAPVFKNVAKLHASKNRDPLQSAASWLSNKVASMQGEAEASPTSGDRMKEITPYTSTSPNSKPETAEEKKIRERAEANLRKVPEFGVILNIFKDAADAILSSRLEPNNEFASIVGDSFFTLQMRLSKFLIVQGLRISADILVAYAVCSLLDKARSNTALGRFSFFKTDVIGANPSADTVTGSSYFLSSSFRYFLFGSFSRGSAVSGFIKHYASRYVNAESTIFGGSGGKIITTPKTFFNAPRAWLSEVINFYDLKNAPFIPIVSIPYYLIALANFHGNCHHANGGTFPAGVHPINPQTYVATLSKLGPKELCYWVFLQQFVHATTKAAHLMLKGQSRNISAYFVQRNQPKSKAGKPAPAPITAAAILNQLQKNLMQIFWVYAVSSVGVKVATSDPAQAGFFVSLLQTFHNKILCSFVNPAKGPAYIWSATIFQLLFAHN